MEPDINSIHLFSGLNESSRNLVHHKVTNVRDREYRRSHDSKSLISDSKAELHQSNKAREGESLISANSFLNRSFFKSRDKGDDCRSVSSSVSSSPLQSPTPSRSFTATKIQNNSRLLRQTRSNDCYDLPISSKTKRNYRSKFTYTQQIKEELYNCSGEKPCNLNEEAVVLYQNLDCERRNLLVRKVLCNFMFGAMKKRRERISKMERRIERKKEEVATWIVQNALLRNVERKTKDRILILIGENQQLENLIHSTCLQLRVTRHSQLADKERVMEKQKELNQFKTEIGYTKKMLARTKTDLDQVTKECEAIQLDNEKLIEEKKKLQRETRSIQERKEMLQTSLENERKRSTKQKSEINGLNRQMSDLKVQIVESNKQVETWQNNVKMFDQGNGELRKELLEKEKELKKMLDRSNALKTQIAQLKRDNFKLNQENITLENHLHNCQKDFNKMESTLIVANKTFRDQTLQIMEFEKEVTTIQDENETLRSELHDYKLTNARKRRTWAALELMVISPLESIAQLIFGVNATTVNPSAAQSFKKFCEVFKDPSKSDTI